MTFICFAEVRWSLSVTLRIRGRSCGGKKKFWQGVFCKAGANATAKVVTDNAAFLPTAWLHISMPVVRQCSNLHQEDDKPSKSARV